MSNQAGCLTYRLLYMYICVLATFLSPLISISNPGEIEALKKTTAGG